jgi:D-alanyl-D-alanine carboxypeptidase
MPKSLFDWFERKPVPLGSPITERDMMSPCSIIPRSTERDRMLARGICRSWLGGLFVSVLMLSLLSGCGGESGGSGQSDDSSSARLSEDNVQELDSIIDQEMQDKNLPGVVVGVWIPDEGEYVVAKGEANLDTGRERQPDDPFRIASITKTFTATAILQLVDEGRLSTSDRLSTWYPDFPNADEITVDDLLRMRSGIDDPFDQAFLEDYYDDPEANITAGEIIQLAADRADQFEPPAQVTNYTNVNYTFLQEIVRRVSGNDLGAQIGQGILEPLGMENSLYPTNNNLPGELRGYGWDAESEEFEDKTVLNPAVPGGAGAMISDLSDLRTYAKALCRGDLLEPETQAARLEGETLEDAPDFVRYGEGIELFGDFCGHNGTIMGFSSEMFYLPEEDAVIVVNVNRLDEDDQSKSTDLFLAVTKTLFPEYVDW